MFVSTDNAEVPKELTSTRLGGATSCMSNITSGNAILDDDLQTCFIIEYALHTFTLNIDTPAPTVNITLYTYGIDCEDVFHCKVYTVVPDRCSSVARTLCELEMIENWDVHTGVQINNHSYDQSFTSTGQKYTYKCSAVCNADQSECETINTINIQVASIRKGYICETELSYLTN